jgi:hypothetical protein
MADPVGIDIVTVQDNITAQVKIIAPNTPVYEDTIPDDAQLPRDNQGLLVPYIVLRYGPIRPSYTGKGMAGPRHDEYYATVDVMAVSSKGRRSRQINGAVVSNLIGFKPDGASPISMRTDAGDPAQFVVSSNEARPTQMVSSTRLKFNLNTLSVGSPVTP